ncbi:MAG: WecB/TagA/CpsF family glycosyltransferase [Clostridia bacterium]|nr:WecB/TagA/CpsF family glycosyltransferase [Clostridia bacterium]
MLEYLKKLFIGSNKEFYEFLEKRIKESKKTFVVTANPETLMTGRINTDFHKALIDPETIIVPDGIGVVKAAKMAGIAVKERVTGVETVEYLLSCGNKMGLSVYFYGAKSEVLKKFAGVLSQKYPALKIAGLHDGYTDDENKVFEYISQTKPDLVFVALGIPRQELAVYNNLHLFEKGIFIGCGGSIDVLSGTKKRAPKIFIKLNCEWLYRIICEPKRLGRFYNNNIKFLSIVKKELKK